MLTSIQINSNWYIPRQPSLDSRSTDIAGAMHRGTLSPRTPAYKHLPDAPWDMDKKSLAFGANPY